MTVAPTTGIARFPLVDAAPAQPTRLAAPGAAGCAACGARAGSEAAYCMRCGTALPRAGSRGRPKDVAATRSLQLAAAVVGANAVVGGIALGIVVLVTDSALMGEAALALELLRFLVVGSLVVLAVRAGIRGLRETAGGRLAGRGFAVAGIAVSSVFGVLILGSLLVTLALTLLI